VQAEEEGAAPLKVEESEHYVRMVEPIMLLPTNEETRDKRWVRGREGCPAHRAHTWACLLDPCIGLRFRA